MSQTIADRINRAVKVTGRNSQTSRILIMNGERCRNCGFQEADHQEHPDCNCQTYTPPATVFCKGHKCKCGRTVRIMQEQWMEHDQPQIHRYIAAHNEPGDSGRSYGTKWNRKVSCRFSLREWKEPETDKPASISHAVYMLTPTGPIDIGS